MTVLEIVTVAVAVFCGLATTITGILIWIMLTGRDRAYKEKYDRFLQHRERVERKLGDNEGP